MRASSWDIQPTSSMGIPVFDLFGKVAIITGAASQAGIGFAIARTFAAYGADVVLADIDGTAVENRAAEIVAGTDTRCIGVACDITDPQDRSRLVQETLLAFGKVNVLVNNAGLCSVRSQRALDVDQEEWDLIIDTNLKATFFLSQLVAREMTRNEEGTIINIASVAAIMAVKRKMPYLAAEAGIVQMTRGMALEWSRYNIRANCICPGTVKTDMTKDMLKRKRATDTLARQVPHNRKTAEPMDVAAAALFLASDSSDMVNGAVLPVDGARSVW